MLLIYPVYYLLLWRFFRDFVPAFWYSNGVSFLTQTLQLVCAFFILKSLGLTTHYFYYLTLFLVAAVVSIIPLTLGGLGSREFVFLIAPGYLPVSGDLGVAFALIYFFITAVSSFLGLILTFVDEQ
jgi:uncharacterized membrane protein YbhN (UPF0104 family)